MLQDNKTKTDRLQRSVLGSILLEDRCFYDVSDMITPGMFSGWLRGVAELIWEQMESGGKLSPAALAHDASSRYDVQESSIYDLIQFANPKTLQQDADKLKVEYYRQQEIQIHRAALGKLTKGIDPDQVVSDSQAERDLIYDFSQDENETRTAKVMNWFDRILKARNSDAPVGIQTPFAGINEIFGGLHLTNYTILAGRPGMGKTTLLLDLIYHAVQNKIPALFFSLEMSYNEILSLLAQKATGILNKDMRAGKLTDRDVQSIQQFMSDFYELPIFIETGTYYVSDLKHKARLYARKYGIKIIGIDYLQLMGIRDYRGNRNGEIEQISRALKSLASETDCNAALIALSQLSRAVETRGGMKRPQLSDLRDSGSLEQDADNIIFTYRGDYYNILEDEHGESTKRIVEVIVAKNRHVSDGTGTIKLRYDPIYNRMHNFSEEIEEREVEFSENIIQTIPAVAFDPDNDDVPF